MIRQGDYDLAAVVAESGRCCNRCGTGSCASRHDTWYRKRITDLGTGEVFETVPILRVEFCDGKTASLIPAELWRGRCTVGSVLETVVRVLRDGVPDAYEWTWMGGTGEEVVSRRTVGRWRHLVLGRLVGSAFSWLGPRLGVSWSDALDAASQLDSLLDHLTPTVLLGFRVASGHAVLDKPRLPRKPQRSPSRRVAGRLAGTSPHNVPSPRRRRGAWSRSPSRGPPGEPPEEDRPS